MPKRPYDDSDEEKWEKKLKKYQKKLDRKRKKRRVLIYSDSDDGNIAENEKEHELQWPPEPEIPLSDVPPRDETPCDAPPCEEAACSIPLCDVPPIPSIPLCDDSEAPIIDTEFLQALGDAHIESPVWGDEISTHLTERWEPILKSGLKKELKEELNKKYLFPKNSPSCKPPLLNPEIGAIVTDSSRNRDNRIITKQEQLGRSLAALGKAMSGIMTKSMETPQVLQILNDVGKLVADSHYLETDTRRTLIMPLLDKSFVDPIKDRKRDGYLFGDHLKDFIKSSRGIKKSGQLITPPQTSHLNWRSPSTSQPRIQRPARAPQSRGGGSSRAQWSGRRRAPYQPMGQPHQPPAYTATTRRQAQPAAPATSYRPPPAPSTSRARNPTK